MDGKESGAGRGDREVQAPVSDELKCEICKQPAIGVGCSPFVPISSAYCVECLQTGRQPWAVLVFGLCDWSRDAIEDSIAKVIRATCEFYGKTEDEFWTEATELAREMDEIESEEDDAGT